MLSAPTDQPIVARQKQASAVRRTLAIVLVFNCIVVAIKVVVGLRAHALSMLGAALESGLDLLNNLIGMALVSVAARGPDEEHPYGHEKFETLGALAIVGFLSISCFELLRSAVSQLVTGAHTLAPTNAELLFVCATIGANIYVVWLERKRGRQLNSAFLLADAAHTGTDVWVTLLAIGSLVLARMGWERADPWLALLVAAFIARSGVHILREIVPILVDERGVDPAELRAAIAEVTEIADVRSVRSRRAPSGTLFAEVTVGVRGTIPVDHAHQLADEVEERIRARLGSSEVTVHVEPA